jgi:hypothetical protein
MFKTAKSILGLALALGGASLASAIPITFYYNGSAYGTMDLSVVNGSTIQVQFTGAAPGSIDGITDLQVTGFAFSFTQAGPITISNPGNAEYANDMNTLNWIALTNLNAIPQPANSDISKDDFQMGATDGNNNGYNPPGIHLGEMDVFRLSGFSGLTETTDLASLVTLQGIRIQAIEPGGGSLFLVGGSTPPPAVPEPTSVALLGLGLLGTAALAKRKRKA